MPDPKKKSALAIMFGAPDKGEPDEDDAPDGESGFDQACAEMMAAIKSGDQQGFCEALKAAIDMRHAEPDGDEGEEY